MKYILTFAVLSMVALLSGCPPVATVEPLYSWDAKEKVEDPGLVGKWISYEWGDGEHGIAPISLDLSRNTNGSQVLTEFDLEAAMPGTGSAYRAVLVQLGKHEFLDVTPKTDDIYQHEFLQHAIVTHTIYRVKREGDELRVAKFCRGPCSSCSFSR